MITKIASHELVTRYERFELSGYLFGDNQQTAFALSYPRAGVPPEETLLRIQYGCINGTVFGAIDCDCAWQIEAALNQIKVAQCGIFIYFADHEGFGLGLAGKMRIVADEKTTGKSFLEVTKIRGVPAVASDVLWVVPHIFEDLKLPKKIIMLGRNPAKAKRLQELGFEIVRSSEIVIDESKLTDDAIRERASKNF
jgi:GTP cyclohydrolase II